MCLDEQVANDGKAFARGPGAFVWTSLLFDGVAESGCGDETTKRNKHLLTCIASWLTSVCATNRRGDSTSVGTSDWVQLGGT